MSVEDMGSGTTYAVILGMMLVCVCCIITLVGGEIPDGGNTAPETPTPMVAEEDFLASCLAGCEAMYGPGAGMADVESLSGCCDFCHSQ